MTHRANFTWFVDSMVFYLIIDLEKWYVQGLPHLTASDLSSARKLLLQALLQAIVPDSDYFESVTDSLVHLDENEGYLLSITSSEPTLGKDVESQSCSLSNGDKGNA